MASKLYKILLEADDENSFEDNPDGKTTSNSTDYTEKVEEISKDDKEETNDAPPEEDNGDEESNNEDQDNPSNEETDGSEDDYNDEDFGDEDMGMDGTDPGETKQRLMLIKDFMNLYQFINDTIEKLNSNANINLIIQQVINRVNDNLRQLRDQLYDYITCDFKKDSYINGLTIYNYFIKAIKVNSQMVIKVSEYNSKNEQKSNSNSSKSKVRSKKRQ